MTAPPSRNLLRVNLGGDLNTLDPQLASSLLDFSVLRQLSEGLLGSEENLRLTTRLAVEVPTIENGRISADGLTYTFKLRGGLIWSDGVPLTAQDFEYTFKRVLSLDVLAPYASLYSAILGGEEHRLSAEESPDV